jgi:small subunit ribosomal protein S29
MIRNVDWILFFFQGCGKSAALAQVVFWARKKGWLVIYVPSGYELINGGSYLDRSEERKEEYCSWEQPPLQYIFLNKLLDAHADKLKKIPLKTKVSLPKFTGTTLFELVEYGSVLIQYTSAVWSLLRNELALVTEFPVLLAVDEYNAVYNPSVSFRNPDSSKYLKEPMNPRQFTTAELFIDAHNGPKLAYGTFAGAYLAKAWHCRQS